MKKDCLKGSLSCIEKNPQQGLGTYPPPRANENKPCATQSTPRASPAQGCVTKSTSCASPAQPRASLAQCCADKSTPCARLTQDGSLATQYRMKFARHRKLKTQDWMLKTQ